MTETANEQVELNGDSTQNSDESGEQQPVSYKGTKHKVVIDGQEQEVDYDDLVKDYSLRQASYKRMEDASKLSKEIQPYKPLIEKLKSGDLSVLRELGVSKEAIRNFSEKELIEYLEYQEKSPDERARLDAEKARDKALKEADELKKKQEEQDRNKLAAQASQEIETEIVGALKEIKIPIKGNFRLVRRVAEDMLGHLNSTGKRCSAQEAVNRVLKGFDDEYFEYATRESERDIDAFIHRLPKKVLDGIRKADLKKVQSQLPLGNVVDAMGNKKSAPIDDDFRSYMRKEMGRA